MFIDSGPSMSAACRRKRGESGMALLTLCEVDLGQFSLARAAGGLSNVLMDFTRRLLVKVHADDL